MEKDRLDYYIAVVEEGSISAAARRLHISQPPLTIQIHNLEEEFGIKLFERKARGVIPTEAGKKLYEYSIRISALRKEAELELRKKQTSRPEKLRLGSVSSGFCPEFFKCLSRFLNMNHHVSINIYDGNTYQIINDLENKQINLAIIRTPFREKNLDTIVLRKDYFVAYGTDTWMKKFSEETISLKQLVGYPLIIYRRWEEIIRDQFQKCGIIPEFICINDDARTSLQWAEEGIGIALLPSSILSLSKRGTAIRIDSSGLTSSICLACSKSSTLSNLEKQFWETFSVYNEQRP